MRRRFRPGGLHPVGCWGIGLMVLGLLLLIWALPNWLWIGLLGLIFIAIGLCLLRWG